MWTKKCGKTGKNVSVIGFGGMGFTKPEDIDGEAELVRYAHTKGIDYFDTAPYYCEDKSEEIMGAANFTLPPQRMAPSRTPAKPSTRKGNRP